MKVRLTGTGSMWTEYGCASVLVDENIMIDLPGGLSKTLLRMGVDPFGIDSVLLTHMHGDHTLELPVWALNRVKHGAAEKSSRICAAAEHAEGIRKLMALSFSESLKEENISRFFEFVAEDCFSAGPYRVRRIPVSHGSLPSCGYELCDGKNTVSVSGDTCMCDGLRQMAAESVLLICETALPEGNDKHMGVRDVVCLAEEFPDCRIITTHMGDEARKLLEKENAGNLIIGTDGMECCIS